MLAFLHHLLRTNSELLYHFHYNFLFYFNLINIKCQNYSVGYTDGPIGKPIKYQPTVSKIQEIDIIVKYGII